MRHHTLRCLCSMDQNEVSDGILGYTSALMMRKLSPAPALVSWSKRCGPSTSSAAERWGPRPTSASAHVKLIQVTSPLKTSLTAFPWRLPDVEVRCGVNELALQDNDKTDIRSGRAPTSLHLCKLGPLQPARHQMRPLSNVM